MEYTQNREYHFIINPRARSGLGHLIWNRLKAKLHRRQISFCEHFTKYPGHACRIARELTRSLPDESGKQLVIVALGGDGTVNEVINGLENMEHVLFGYIPIGSGNDFARGMGLPRIPEESLEMILDKGEEMQIDLGVVRRGGKTRRFAVSSGMGFDAAVCHEVCVSPWKKFLNRMKLGRLSYVLIALHRIIGDKPAQITIRDREGHEKQFSKAYFAAVMNQQFEGGGIRFSPKAKPDDGLLDVIVISKLPKLLLILLLPTAFAGLHIYFPGVYTCQAKAVKIKSDRPLPLHADGEPLFLRDEMEAGISRRKLRILVPKEEGGQ